jgi:hypothetical protein|tara:strand:- start:115 stop:288 length:174 start_codon:yes stop_codon:yes gene_type:complete
MGLQIDNEIVDEKKISREVTVAIENIKQLEEQRDVMMVNLERNRILLEHYKKIVKER